MTAVSLLVISLSACSSPTKSGINGTASTGHGVGQPSPFLGGNLSSISCGSGDLCAAGGAPFQAGILSPVLAYSHTAGIKWAPARAVTGAGATITSTACSETRCLAVGAEGQLPLLLSIARSSSTRTWVTANQPAAGTLVSVGCSGASTCIGLVRTESGAVATVRSAGASWSTLGQPPTDLATPVRMSCSSPTTCTAVGTSATGAPVVLITRNGGGAWSVAQISKKASVILGASCRSDGRCWVVGRKGSAPLLASSQRLGAPFVKVTPVDGLSTPNDVSCSASTCVLVGADLASNGAAVALTGAASTVLDLSYVPTPLLAVSCASAHACSAASAGSLVALAP